MDCILPLDLLMNRYILTANFEWRFLIYVMVNLDFCTVSTMTFFQLEPENRTRSAGFFRFRSGDRLELVLFFLSIQYSKARISEFKELDLSG